MSCYTRHLGDWLPPEPTWADRRALDAVVRSELGLADADCPEVWEAVEQQLDSGLGDRVRAKLAGGEA